MWRTVCRFLADQGGAVAPLFAVALVSLVAMGAVAWDVSRAFAFRAELDAAVDAAALSGATQLDGKTDARTRATAAAQGAFVQNAQRLGNTIESDVTIATGDIRFLQDLTTRTVATTDANAEFIEITLTPRQRSLVMGAVLRLSNFNVRAHAVAGFGSGLCLAPPLMICNPLEPTGNTDKYYAFDGDSYTGKSVVLTPSGNQSAVPGQFGYLQVGTNQELWRALARSPPQTDCYGTSVEPSPGNVTSADKWINVRFDLYENGSGTGSTGSVKSDPNYPPAMNTMIGVATTTGNACTATPVAPTNDCSDTTAVAAFAFPKDCGMTGILGGGTWNVGKYFASNHNGVATINGPTSITFTPPDLPNSPYTGSGWASYGPSPASGLTTPTRFQVYNWELAVLSGAIARPSGVFSNSQDVPSGTADFAKPQCYTGTAAQTSPDRRLISAVVVNCIANDVRGSTTNNPGNEAIVAAYLDLFLTAPVQSQNLYGEIVRATPAPAALQATRRDWVRLYE